MSDSSQNIPDAVLAVITQFILGVALATSAVPPTVLSFQDRASETMGVFLIILITATIAHPLRAAFGSKDLTQSEYILAVLAPIVTRLDLGLMIWVNVNKALVWAEQMFYASREEFDCVALLILASRVWHNDDNRIYDPEFGFYGGEAAMLMHRLEMDYNPRNAGGNVLAWFGHLTLWPFAVVFHVLLQMIAVVGFGAFWVLAAVARFTGGDVKDAQLCLRGSYLDFLLRRREGHQRKLFMRRQVAAVLDSKQHLIKARKSDVRHKWAMLASVDAILKHEHFRKLMSISYPMRAPLVYQRTLADPVARDVTAILNQEQILFQDCPDDPLAGIGEEASRQIVLFRLLGWPKHTAYSKLCLQSLTRFAESNMKAWKATEKQVFAQKKVHAEFVSIRDILRRNLVQLVMLAWCDGLGECHQAEAVTDVSADLAYYFMQGRLPGTEMAVRLCNVESSWNDKHQTSSMVLSLRGDLEECNCRLCREMNENRRLTTERYQMRPTVQEVGDGLEREGCQKARSIESVWKNAVTQWIGDIFEPRIDSTGIPEP